MASHFFLLLWLLAATYSTALASDSSHLQGFCIADPQLTEKHNRNEVVAGPKKIIIDTDPGIDDAMAIFLALKSPEVEVIGLTTVFGNVYTTLATKNALHLLEFAGKTHIPVAEGTHVTMTNDAKVEVCDYVHGADGLGNVNADAPEGKAIEQNAVDFLIEQASLYPGEVTVVTLGALANVAKAIQKDPAFIKNIGQIIILGGEFSIDGETQPPAEANIIEDPEAADIVYSSGADVVAIGLNITYKVFIDEADRVKMVESNAKLAQYLAKMLEVYYQYHIKYHNKEGAYLHDPTVILAAVDPSLFTYVEGTVRVETSGPKRGVTLFQKRFEEVGECNKPMVKVGVTVDAPAVIKLMMERFMDS